MARAVILLDRDGTLNIDKGYVHRAEDWEFTERAVEALRALRDAGYALAVVTNQSGIARGYFTSAEVRALHEHVQRQLAQGGVQLDVIAICPHAPEDACACRKPLTGMVQQVAAELGEPIAYDRSWVIGDKPSDLEFGQALGCRTALLRSRYWDDDQLRAAPDLIADSFHQAAQAILALGSGKPGFGRPH